MAKLKTPPPNLNSIFNEQPNLAPSARRIDQSRIFPAVRGGDLAHIVQTRN